MKDDHGGNYVVANGKEDFNKLGRIEHDADTDDSKDSDAVQLFELPKRKLVRPISSSLRRKVRDSNQCWATTKECCRVFVTVTVPMLIAVFIVSTVLCLAFLLVGIAGMKQEISILKSRLKNVDAAEQNFVAKKEQLRKQFRDKLNDIVSYQTELQKVQGSVRRLSSYLGKLNITMHSFHRKPVSQVASSVTILKNDLETVKSGMADTGAEIEKLKANGKEMSEKVKTLQGQLTGVNRDLYNMTVQISLIEHKQPPPLKTTPKMLVVSMTPDLNKPVIRKELNGMLADLEKRQTESCRKEVSLYDQRLEKLYNETLQMNKTYSNEMSHLRHYLHVLQNPTEQSKVFIGNVSHIVNSTVKADVINTTARTTRTAKPLQKSSSSKPLASVPSPQAVNVTAVPIHGNQSNINTTSVATHTKSKQIHTNSSEGVVHDEERGYNDMRSDERLEPFNNNQQMDQLDSLTPKRRKKRGLLHFFDTRNPN